MGQFTRLMTNRPRQCGKCHACCVASEIVEFGKPAYTRCPQLSNGCCGIYGERPPVCRKYQCSWLAGNGRESERPDKLGVYLDFTDEGPYGPIAWIQECVDGAIETDEVIDFVRRSNLMGQFIIVGLTPRGKFLIGGREPQVTRYRKALREARISGQETGFVDV